MNGFGVRWVLLVLLVLRVIFPFQLCFPYSSFLFAIQFGQPPWWPISGHFSGDGELSSDRRKRRTSLGELFHAIYTLFFDFCASCEGFPIGFLQFGCFQLIK